MRGGYKDGVLDGSVVVYNKNGQLQEQVTGTYKDGIKID
jgi:antitoxin component YwqK of YwqJK toxin-antitoxin module|tara:strand:- start:45 stop:161 length:117 start_codon:yes stop_codon:yes gene_type:complete